MPVRGLTPWWGPVLDAPDPVALAEFYSALLGWPIDSRDPTWATVKSADGTAYLGIHANDRYEPPTWPSEAGVQQQQAHLDFGVADPAQAVEDAIALGARLAEYQPQDDVRVMLDPVGHPFCFYTDRPD